MNTLTLKSKVDLSTSVDSHYNNYVKRVREAGGVIVDKANTKKAFEFIVNNGIKPSNIFSATSPSWGVLEDRGIPIKLFSLFNALGDINIVVQETDVIKFTKTPDGKQALFMNANKLNNSASRAESVGTLYAGNAVAVAVASKGMDTGAQISAGAGVLDLSSDDAVYLNTSLKYRYLTFQYLTNSNTLTSTWTGSIKSHSRQGTADIAAPIAESWNKKVMFVGDAELSTFNSAGVTQTMITYPSYAEKNNLRLILGYVTTRSSTTGLQIYSSMLRGYIAETWVLNNATYVNAQALALKLEQDYA